MKMITNLSQQELIANMEATAEKLAGRPVTVRFMKLPGGAVGLAKKGMQGQAVIDMDTSTLTNIALFVDTFGHEIAHIVKHFHTMPRVDVNKDHAQDIALEALHLASPKGNPIVKQHEDEAYALARTWRELVNRFHSGYVAATNDPALAALKILYHKT